MDTHRLQVCMYIHTYIHTMTGEAEAETGGLVVMCRGKGEPVMTGTAAPHPAIPRRFVNQCHDDAKERRNQKA